MFFACKTIYQCYSLNALKIFMSPFMCYSVEYFLVCGCVYNKCILKKLQIWVSDQERNGFFSCMKFQTYLKINIAKLALK